MQRKVILADGEELDMSDRESIVAYAHRQLAISVEPTAPQLRRLEMLLEVASKLPDRSRSLHDVSRTVSIEEVRARLAADRRAQRSGGSEG